MFPNGELVEFFLPYDYDRGSRRVGLFKNLNLYIIGELDLMLMKALAGREQDYRDIRELRKKISRESLIRRFEQLRFKEGMKEKSRKKLDEFIESFYSS